MIESPPAFNKINIPRNKMKGQFIFEKEIDFFLTTLKKINIRFGISNQFIEHFLTDFKNSPIVKLKVGCFIFPVIEKTKV